MPGRKKYKNIGTVMGEDSKVVTTDRKIKEKGKFGKLKYKFNPDGTLKKTVRKKGLRRVVDKPEETLEKL